MAQNNQALFDALLAGASGGTLGRWLTSDTSSSYDSAADAVEAFATAVDAAIPTIGGAGPSISDINLLQSIAQGVVADRNLASIDAETFADIGAAIAAAFAQSRTRLNNQPALSGGGSGPIQYTRYFDPNFEGTTENGSISAPYSLLAPFMAELDASTGKGWLLYVPGLSEMEQDAPVPDLVEGALVVSGVFPDVSIFTTPWIIEQQSGGGSYMAFRDVWLTSLVMNWTGGMQLNFFNCWVDAITAHADLQGTAVFTNTGAANIAFPAAGNFSIRMYGGGLSGNCSWSNGEIYNASIGGGSTYVLGNGVTKFVGCTFGSGITIDNTHTPVLEMDTFSHSTFISSGVTFGGTVNVLS